MYKMKFFWIIKEEILSSVVKIYIETTYKLNFPWNHYLFKKYRKQFFHIMYLFIFNSSWKLKLCKERLCKKWIVIWVETWEKCFVMVRNDSLSELSLMPLYWQKKDGPRISVGDSVRLSAPGGTRIVGTVHGTFVFVPSIQSSGMNTLLYNCIKMTRTHQSYG